MVIIEKEKAEKERLEKEKAEKERLEKEKAEKEKEEQKALDEEKEKEKKNMSIGSHYNKGDDGCVYKYQA